MSADLWVQLIGTFLTGAVAFYAAHKSAETAHRELEAAREESERKHAENIQLIEYRIKELEEKMDKHNNLVERMSVVETKMKMKEI